MKGFLNIFRPVVKKPLKNISFSDIFESYDLITEKAKIIVEKQMELLVEKHAEICFIREIYLKKLGSSPEIKQLLTYVIEYNFSQFLTMML